MATKDEIILEYGKWIFDRQNTNINVKRDRIFTLGSLTLGILSITSGILAIYISLGRTNSTNFILFSVSIVMLVFSLSICFWNFKSVQYEELTFFQDDIDELKKEKDADLLNKLIIKVEYAYKTNETRFFPDELKEDTIRKAFLSALILDFMAILLLIVIGIIEFIN